jgi:hypothetical protein
VNYSLKVIELVSLLLIVNYIADLMMCVILVLCMIYHVYSACFGGSLSREVAKIDEYKGSRISRGSPLGPTDEYMGSPVRICTPTPSTFVGDVSPMNVIRYIHRFHVINEYIVTFVGTNE